MRHPLSLGPLVLACTLAAALGACDDGEGLKYEIERGVASGKSRLFTTTFNFDH